MHRSIKQLLAGRTTKIMSHKLLLPHAFLKSSARSPCKTTSNSIQNKLQVKCSSKTILSTLGTALPAKLHILLLKLP
jgi:hypothetical protein